MALSIEEALIVVRSTIRNPAVPALALLLAFLFMSLPVAQAQTAPPPLEETAGPMGAVIFGILFVLFCVGFAWMVWRGDKTKKSDTESKKV